MPKSGYPGMIMIFCMMLLFCTAAGCINFGAMIPGSGQGGSDSGGSGTGAGPAGWTGAGSGSGGVSPSGPASGGTGSGNYPTGMPTAGGGAAAAGCSELTPMHTYFTVKCHYHSELGPEDSNSWKRIEDSTVSGDIPIEMVREWDQPPVSYQDIWKSEGGKVNLQYMLHEKCVPGDEFCGDCKYTYSGPAIGWAVIQRAPSGGIHDWTAVFSFGSAQEWAEWSSKFDQDSFSPYACPPRDGWYPEGVDRKNTPPDVQQVLPGCTEEISQDIMNLNAVPSPSCAPGFDNPLPFVLRDGEVITYKWSSDTETIESSYTFHISGR